MGPQARYLGGDVPDEVLLWQDPIPEVDYPQIDEDHITTLKAEILDSDLTVPELVRTGAHVAVGQLEPGFGESQLEFFWILEKALGDLAIGRIFLE